jgi:hypothetical protein
VNNGKKKKKKESDVLWILYVLSKFPELRPTIIRI